MEKQLYENKKQTTTTTKQKREREREHSDGMQKNCVSLPSCEVTMGERHKGRQAAWIGAFYNEILGVDTIPTPVRRLTQAGKPRGTPFKIL